VVRESEFHAASPTTLTPRRNNISHRDPERGAHTFERRNAIPVRNGAPQTNHVV